MVACGLDASYEAELADRPPADGLTGASAS
jgi:hypothetical protein